jgi:hypothetical protein
MVEEINEVQQMQFDLIKTRRFNSFNGEHVVDKLIEHRDW